MKGYYWMKEQEKAREARTNRLTTPPLTIMFPSIGDYNKKKLKIKPKSGYKYVIADFGIKNTGIQTGYFFNESKVILSDLSGVQYTYAHIPENICFAIIPYGQIQMFHLIFEVPKSQGPGTTYWLNVKP